MLLNSRVIIRRLSQGRILTTLVIALFRFLKRKAVERPLSNYFDLATENNKTLQSLSNPVSKSNIKATMKWLHVKNSSIRNDFKCSKRGNNLELFPQKHAFCPPG